MTTAARNASARYLEEAKIEDLTRQLRRQGYDVEIPPQGNNTVFDLVATKSGRKIVFEVKASPADPTNIEDIARRRAAAFAQGFDEFRLVVVNPPHETRVNIPGLEDHLCAFLGERGAGELDDLPGLTRVEAVNQVDIDTVEITTAGIHLVGSGIVAIEIEHDGGEDRDGPTWRTDFPFTFDVVLGPDLRIDKEHSSVRVDTSSFYE